MLATQTQVRPRRRWLRLGLLFVGLVVVLLITSGVVSTYAPLTGHSTETVTVVASSGDRPAPAGAPTELPLAP